MVRAASATSYPARARCTATALPIPRLAPVTNATPRESDTCFPLNGFGSVVFGSVVAGHGDGVGVDARSEQRTGLRAGQTTTLDDGLAVHDHLLHADRARVQPQRA